MTLSQPKPEAINERRAGQKPQLQGYQPYRVFLPLEYTHKPHVTMLLRPRGLMPSPPGSVEEAGSARPTVVL